MLPLRLESIDPKHKRGIPLKVIDQWIEEVIIDYLGTTDDVRPYINSADCIVLPSYREGTPRTLLEAASSSRAIVATDVPGCNNVVIDGYNGLLCKERSAVDLADKMFAMLNLSEKEIDQMGENGRKLVEERFDENLVITKYLDTVHEVIRKTA